MNPRMNPRKVAALTLAALLTPIFSTIASADSSYQSSTQITGGQLVDTVKRMSFLSKSMRNMFDPVNTQTMVSGNRKATIGKDEAEIIDLDKKEMIHIDIAHRTYWVVTFAQMREAMQAAAERVQETPQQNNAPQPQEQQKPNVKLTFNASVNNTGQSKLVNGMNAQEQIVTLTMTATDETNPANTSAYTVTTDAWIVPDPPELKEIAEFDRRMAREMMLDVYGPAMMGSLGGSGSGSRGGSGAGLAQMLSSHPGATDAMTQMAKELAKIKGTRVLEDMSMSATAPQNSSQQQQQQQQSNSDSSSGSQSVQSAAAGKLIGGMLGGWHKKKRAQSDDQPQSDTTTETTQNGQVMQTVTLLSMRDQKSDFSQQPIPDSAFAIPAGFTQVPSAYDRMK